MEKFQYISMVNFKISLLENQYLPFRSSHSQMFFKAGSLKSCAIFAEKNSALKSLFNKVPVLQACKFIKKKLQQRCFPVNIAKFLRRAFFIEHFWWLLLPFTTTFQNYYWKDRLIIVNKDHVYSKPEKQLKKKS